MSVQNPVDLKKFRRHLDGLEKRVAKADVDRDGRIESEGAGASEWEKLPRELQELYWVVRRRNGDKPVTAGQLKAIIARDFAALRKLDRNKDGVLTVDETERGGKLYKNELSDAFHEYQRRINPPPAITPAQVQAGRAALVKYVEEVMFNPRTENGKEYLGNKHEGRKLTDPVVQRDKNKLLALAQRWRPGRTWELYPGASPTYWGKFAGFSTEVTTPRTGKARVVMTIEY